VGVYWINSADGVTSLGHFTTSRVEHYHAGEELVSNLIFLLIYSAAFDVYI
jgi:hypothetical protein